MRVVYEILRHASEARVPVDPRTIANRAGVRPHQVRHDLARGAAVPSDL